MTELKINWNDMVKKEARGLDYAYLGEVQGLRRLSITKEVWLINIHSTSLKF